MTAWRITDYADAIIIYLAGALIAAMLIGKWFKNNK